MRCGSGHLARGALQAQAGHAGGVSGLPGGGQLENVLGGNCFSDSRSDRAYFWRNDYDNETKLIEMRLEFFVRAHGAASAGGAPLYERFSERHIQRAHTAEELVSRLRAAGFADISVCDAFTFDPPAEESERLQFAASKPKE